MDSDSRSFPEWDSLNRSQQVETMAWYNEKLDSDLEEEISKHEVNTFFGNTSSLLYWLTFTIYESIFCCDCAWLPV
jgi:hypothetical protein